MRANYTYFLKTTLFNTTGTYQAYHPRSHRCINYLEIIKNGFYIKFIRIFNPNGLKIIIRIHLEEIILFAK